MPCQVSGVQGKPCPARMCLTVLDPPLISDRRSRLRSYRLALLSTIALTGTFS